MDNIIIGANGFGVSGNGLWDTGYRFTGQHNNT